MKYNNILHSVDSSILSNLNNVSQRYYEHKYCTLIENIEEAIHQRVCFHSNRIVMLSLACNHPVMKENKTIANINWQINESTDRSKNAATGKGKKGAQKLKPDSVLCYLQCEDGSSYPVYSCLTGKLIEINENLRGNPNLLITKPVSEGYIALLLPFLHLYNDLKGSMINEDEYNLLAQ